MDLGIIGKRLQEDNNMNEEMNFNQNEFDENDYDPNSVIGEDERFAELDAFLMYLQELKDKPHIQMINPVRFNEFRYACNAITRAVKDEVPDAKIEYEINDGEVGDGDITIIANEIIVRDIKRFISGLKMAHNFEVYPRTDGNIQMNILFNGIMERKNLE